VSEDPFAWYKSKVLWVICALQYASDLTNVINGISANYLAKDFGLDVSKIPMLFAWITIGALGTMYLSRLTDAHRRQKFVLFDC
jgi:hypothetical protein